MSLRGQSSTSKLCGHGRGECHRDFATVAVVSFPPPGRKRCAAVCLFPLSPPLLQARPPPTSHRPRVVLRWSSLKVESSLHRVTPAFACTFFMRRNKNKSG